MPSPGATHDIRNVALCLGLLQSTLLGISGLPNKPHLGPFSPKLTGLPRNSWGKVYSPFPRDIFKDEGLPSLVPGALDQPSQPSLIYYSDLSYSSVLQTLWIDVFHKFVLLGVKLRLQSSESFLTWT